MNRMGSGWGLPPVKVWSFHTKLRQKTDRFKMNSDTFVSLLVVSQPRPVVVFSCGSRVVKWTWTKRLVASVEVYSVFACMPDIITFLFTMFSYSLYFYFDLWCVCVCLISWRWWRFCSVLFGCNSPLKRRPVCLDSQVEVGCFCAI